MQTAGERRSVLIVDDEESLAWSLSTRLAKLRPRYDVDTAYDGATALAKLAERPVELLVADVRMPGMNGIDLVLAAIELNPDLRVIVMTAFETADVERLTEGSAILFLEKPFNFESFLSHVDRTLARGQKGFSGAISVQTLPDIVQLYVLSNATGALLVRQEENVGQIWFEHGTVPHACTGELRGEDAFFEIMMWSGGEFSMKMGAAPPERSVSANWQELLMESCRRIDERVRRESCPEIQVKGWTLTPPPSLEEGASDAVDPLDASIAELELEASPATTRRPGPPEPQSKERTMNIKDSLAKLTNIDGFVGAALVDSESGMLLGSEGGGTMNLEIAAAGNTEVVKAKRKTMNNLGIKENLEDLLISLSKQYHLIRPLRSRSTLFFYVVLDRTRANLALARIALADVEKELQV